MRILAVVLCGMILAGCGGTSFKIAPSTTKVTTKLATARRSVQHEQSLTKTLEATTKETQTKATTTGEHIDAALKSITAKDYVTAAQELVAAKVSNEVVMSMLVQSFRNVVSLGESLKQEDSDLVAAEEEVKNVNKAFETVVLQGAKDRAIVQEVNWGFRIGALLYFVKGILKMGFIGGLILLVLVIALIVIGFATGAPMLKIGTGIFSWWRNRKPKE